MAILYVDEIEYGELTYTEESFELKIFCHQSQGILIALLLCRLIASLHFMKLFLAFRFLIVADLVYSFFSTYK